MRLPITLKELGTTWLHFPLFFRTFLWKRSLLLPHTPAALANSNCGGFAASYLEQRKSVSTAIWVLAFCGWFGGHYYYLGDVGKGIIFTLTLSVGGVMWLVDALRIKKLVIAANSNLARQITAGMR